MTKLRHESGGRQIDVNPDTVEVYESQGWQRVSSQRTQKKTQKRAPSRAATEQPASEDAAPEGDD